jgi:hypothetical protein
MAYTLFSSGAAGTGSEISMSGIYDVGLMVFVPSASYSTLGVKLIGRLFDDAGIQQNGTASYFDLAAQPISTSNNSTLVTTITQGGLYFYPYVGGCAVRMISAQTGSVTISANPILKR